MEFQILILLWSDDGFINDKILVDRYADVLNGKVSFGFKSLLNSIHSVKYSIFWFTPQIELKNADNSEIKMNLETMYFILSQQNIITNEDNRTIKIYNLLSHYTTYQREKIIVHTDVPII